MLFRSVDVVRPETGVGQRQRRREERVESRPDREQGVSQRLGTPLLTP